MHCTILITRPARAAAAVGFVGGLLVTQAALALAGSSLAAAVTLVAAIAVATAAIGVTAPLHSRSGAVGLALARAGLVLAAVPALGASLTGWPHWLPILVGALTVAAAGMGVLVLARRREGDLPPRLLELTLAATVLGIVFAAFGGCLVAGALWLGLAVALRSAYAPAGAASPAHQVG